MKKTICIILVLITILTTFISCNESEILTIQNETQDTTTDNEKILYIEYSGYGEFIVWNEIERVDYYEILLDGNTKIETIDNYYSTSDLEIGEHRVTINAIKNKSKITAAMLNFEVKGIKEENLNQISTELSYSLVNISIERYNTSLGIIKSDEISEGTQGVICKKNESTYWVICYSTTLRLDKNYDKTNINISKR